MNERAALLIFSVLLIWIGLFCLLVGGLVLMDAFRKMDLQQTAKLAKDLVEKGIIAITYS